VALALVVWPVAGLSGPTLSEDRTTQNVATLAAEASEGSAVRIRAYIDGSDTIKIKGNELWYEHHTWDLPGKWRDLLRNTDHDDPTFINGTAWKPEWQGNISKPFRFRQAAPSREASDWTQVLKVAGRGSVSATDLPKPSNDHTLSILLDDARYGGAEWYEIIVHRGAASAPAEPPKAPATTEPAPPSSAPQARSQQAVPSVAQAKPLTPIPAPNDLPGALIFQGRYKHRSRGQDLSEPSQLWVKQTPDGAILALASLPFMGSTELVAGDKTHQLTAYRSARPPSGSQPGYGLELEFGEGKARLTSRGVRQDHDGKELHVPAGAWFDPNSRPDSYCAANILLRAYAVGKGETREFRVFDWDNTGEALVEYAIRVEHKGKERVEAPAGAFEANHLVLTQATSANTWFKKRAGHVTEFWVLDNHVIVRVLRHREPYEVQLLDHAFPDKLPGRLSTSASASGSKTVPNEAANAATQVADRRAAPAYATDLAAFFREADQTYPFFDLKGIRGDWEQTKAQLSAKVKSCASDTEFLGLVIEAVGCLRDTHMGVLEAKAPMPQRPRRFYPGLSFMPATQGRVIVMSASPNYTDKLKPGMVVTKIDGQDARTVLEAGAKAAWSPENPYYVSSPQRARLFAYRLALAGSSGEAHALHYLTEGRERELAVSCQTEVRGWPHTYNLPANLATAGGNLRYGRLASGVGYVYLRNVGEETEAGLAQALKAHPETKGWIVDLRGNGGGGYDQKLVERLQAIPPPVAVLIDAGSVSAGETLARDLAQHAKARLFGSRTAGASSSKRTWTFPSGIAKVRFSVRSRWRSDGQPIEFNGIAPEVEIEAAPEEVAQGLNSEILRAEEYLRHAQAPAQGKRAK
jgi:hypothetical protein